MQNTMFGGGVSFYMKLQ